MNQSIQIEETRARYDKHPLMLVNPSAVVGEFAGTEYVVPDSEWKQVLLVADERQPYNAKPKRLLQPARAAKRLITNPDQPTYKSLELGNIVPIKKAPPLMKQQTKFKEAFNQLRLIFPKAVDTPLGPVELNDKFITHIVGKTEHRERYGKHILDTLNDPDEIWLTEYLYADTKEHAVFRQRYLSVYKDYKKSIVVIVERASAGEFVVTAFPQRNVNSLRMGDLIYKRGGA